MDWTKAKTILIAALLVTNLFLIFTYGFDSRKEQAEIDAEELAAFLESKEIYLETEPPEKHPDMQALTARHVTFDEAETASLMESLEPLPQNSADREYERAARDFFDYLGHSLEHAVCSGTERDESTVRVRFQANINGIDLDESFLECTFENGKMIGLAGEWFEPEGFSKRKLETITAEEALLVFMSERPEAETIRITDIQLLYWTGDEYEGDMGYLSITALPAWKITYNEGETVYIDALEM